MEFYDRRIADETDTREWPERGELKRQGPSSISYTEGLRRLGIDHKDR